MHSQAPYPTSSVGNRRPAENALPSFSTTAVVPGSWAYEQRGLLNEESDSDSSRSLPLSSIRQNSGSEEDNACGVGYDPPGDACLDLNLGFLTSFPSGFDPDEFLLGGSIGTFFMSPLCGSQSRCESSLLRGALGTHSLISFVHVFLIPALWGQLCQEVPRW